MSKMVPEQWYRCILMHTSSKRKACRPHRKNMLFAGRWLTGQPLCHYEVVSWWAATFWIAFSFGIFDRYILLTTKYLLYIQVKYLLIAFNYLNVMEVIFWAVHGPKDIMHMCSLYFALKKVYINNSLGDLYVN